MAYIAKTNGGNTVIEVRQGTLLDIASADRDNWRNVLQFNPSIDNFSEVRTTVSFEVSENGSAVHMTWNVETLDPLLIKMKLKEHAASVRWQKQNGGISLPDGTKILTDEASQTKIHQVYSILKEGWVETVNFKTPSGWVELDLTAITGIAQLTFSHIQNCFNAEKAIIEAIENGTVTTPSQIDNWNW